MNLLIKSSPGAADNSFAFLITDCIHDGIIPERSFFSNFDCAWINFSIPFLRMGVISRFPADLSSISCPIQFNSIHTNILLTFSASSKVFWEAAIGVVTEYQINFIKIKFQLIKSKILSIIKFKQRQLTENWRNAANEKDDRNEWFHFSKRFYWYLWISLCKKWR